MGMRQPGSIPDKPQLIVGQDAIAAAFRGGGSISVQGETWMTSRAKHQLNSLRTAARFRFAITGARSRTVSSKAMTSRLVMS